MIRDAILVVIILIISLIVYLGYNALKDRPLKQYCPDEMIINKMPGTNMDQNNSYYIKDNIRFEINDFDKEWLEQNCKIPVQEVF